MFTSIIAMIFDLVKHILTSITKGVKWTLITIVVIFAVFMATNTILTYLVTK